MGMMKEFKEFAVKGNVVDLAVGVIIAGAFGKIVSVFVAKIVTPPLGLLMGGVDFNKLGYVLNQAAVDAGTAEPVLLGYGEFFQTILDFIIVAFAIFMVVKGINASKKKEEAAPAAPPKNEVLLEEIRDLLKK